MIQIRYADNDDYKLVQSISANMSKRRWQQFINNKQAAVAFLNEKFAGFALYDFFYDNTPFLTEIFVEEECRRQTVGSFLLLFCEDAARNLGYKNMILTVNEANEAAQKFYKKLGYRQLGSFDDFGTCTQLILGKELKLPECCHSKQQA